jgi:hypothetical protein
VGRLRGYGNAIVAPAADAFIRAVMDALAETQPMALRGHRTQDGIEKVVG